MRVVRIFPNPRSCLRLATALLKEYHEDWITGRRYLRRGRKRRPPKKLKPVA